MKLLLIFSFSFMLFAGSLFADELLANGSFAGDAGSVPSGWSFVKSGNADATVTVADDNGKTVLKFVNNSAKASNVFAGVTQFPKLEADQKYVLTGKIKNNSGNPLLVCFGKEWKTRVYITGSGDNWKKFSYEISLPAGQLEKDGRCMMILIVEAPAAGILLGDLSLQPVQKDSVSLVNSPANVIANGSFESGKPGNAPDGWRFYKSGNADAAITVSADNAADGNSALLLVNRSPRAANVYGALVQYVKILPDTEYELTLSARGAGEFGIFIGKDWKTRYYVKGLSDDWKQFRFKFKIGADQLEKDGNCPVIICIDTPSTGVMADAFAIVPAAAPAPKAAAAPVEVNTANLVLNGSFENGPTGGTPDNWALGISGNAQASLTVTDEAAGLGGRSLLLINKSAMSPNVYGSLVQWVKGIEPDTEYEMSVMIKAVNAKNVLFCFGKNWKVRFRPGNLTADWTKYTFKFKLPASEIDSDGKIPLVIGVDDLAEKIYLDNLAIYPAGKQLVSANELQTEKLWLIPSFSGSLDNLKAIPSGLPVMNFPQSAAFASTGKMPAANEFAGQAALAYDDAGLYFFIRVNDNSANPQSGENMWRGDSIQMRIDQAGLAAKSAQASDLEFGVSVDAQGKVHTWDWTTSKELPREKTKLTALRDASGYFVAGRLDWSLLSEVKYPGKRFLTVSLIGNDANRANQRDVYFLTRGIHDEKDASQYFKALLIDSASAAGVFADNVVTTSSLTGKVIANGEAAKIEARVTDSAGKVNVTGLAPQMTTGKDKLLQLKYDLPLNNAAEGKGTVEFLADGKVLCNFDFSKSDPVKTAALWLDSAAARLTELNHKFAALDSAQKSSLYVTMPLAVLNGKLIAFKNRFANAGNDVKMLYVGRAELMKPGVNAALDDLQKSYDLIQKGGKFPLTYQYQGNLKLVNGWPQAEMLASDGGKSVRQLMFSGYGHFGNMKNDLPNFHAWGENIIQIELGPKGIYPAKGKDREFEPDFKGALGLFQMLDAARDNQLQVCLLISPHYVPQWLLDENPDFKKVKAGFFPCDIAQQPAYRMMKAYINDFLPEVRKRYPGLIQSICILNEPTYNTTLSEPLVAAALVKHLESKFGNVAKFNQLFDRNYADWSAALAAAGKDKAVSSEFILYKRGVMNRWAAFLSDEVRAVWPGMPVHAKIMMTSSSFMAEHAIDPEAFAEISDYNGNDNYFNYGEGGYASDWAITAVGHEIQVSMAKKSIINAENHIIRDAELRPIPNEHIYTANFQQYISGASGLITWVWVDYPPEAEKDVVKDLQGNIALRPGNVIAHAKAGLDASRLAHEISCFARSDPETALIFSPTTLTYSPDSYRSRLFDFYIESAFTGHRVRFISEKQIAAGDFGKVKTIFAVGVSNFPAASAKALAKFNGTVVADKVSLQKDEYDRPLPAVKTVALSDFIKAPQLKKEFLDPVSPLPVSLTAVGAPDTRGVYFRVVPDGKEYVINLVNYNKVPMKLKLSAAGKLYDLINERDFKGEFELPPLQPLLLRLSK